MGLGDHLSWIIDGECGKKRWTENIAEEINNG